LQLAEYATRFPECAAELKKLWAGEQTTDRTQTAKQKSKQRQALDNFQPGEAIDDFDLLTLLGAGAFARVFLARQRSMQRLVALKIATDHSQESQTLAQLDHDHIVRVYDQRLLPDQGLRMLYMQYVPGGTLQSIVPMVWAIPARERTATLLVQAVRQSLESRGEVDRLPIGWAEQATRIPWAEEICRIGIRLARALDYAHHQGVLHRDIKPANVLLTGDGSPKLADFNISFSLHAVNSTATAYFGGSLAYMSPEQMEACHPTQSQKAIALDGLSDLYSLAVVLWELLHGARPFLDDKPAENWQATLDNLLHRRRSSQPIAPSSAGELRGPAAPLMTVLHRCLSVAPRDRYQSGTELAKHLELCLDRRAWSLVMDVDTGWRGLVRRFPMTFAVAGVLAPNIAATIFNIWYNGHEVVPPGAEKAFWSTLTAVNSVAYPAGIWWALDRLKGVFPAVRKGQDGEKDVRRRALFGGVNVGGVCLTLWVVAGFVYPVVLQSRDSFSWTMFVHFLVSLTLCGLVSAVYPFLAVTWLGVKVYYPRLLDLTDETLREDAPALRSIRQWCDVSVMLAATVPLLAVTVLTALGSQARGALITAAAGGLIGFLIAFVASRELRDDLSTLLDVVDRDSGTSPNRR